MIPPRNSFQREPSRTIHCERGSVILFVLGLILLTSLLLTHFINRAHIRAHLRVLDWLTDPKNAGEAADILSSHIPTMNAHAAAGGTVPLHAA